jgi:hypothetical protein
MVRQAHHERNQLFTARPELVCDLIQRILKRKRECKACFAQDANLGNGAKQALRPFIFSPSVAAPDAFVALFNRHYFY